jgi:hypothetical protein
VPAAVEVNATWMSVRPLLRSSRVAPLVSYSQRDPVSLLTHKRIFSYRWYAQNAAGQPPEKQRSRHASWYSDILPSMIPISLLGFVVYGVRITLVFENTFCDWSHP